MWIFWSIDIVMENTMCINTMLCYWLWRSVYFCYFFVMRVASDPISMIIHFLCYIPCAVKKLNRTRNVWRGEEQKLLLDRYVFPWTIYAEWSLVMHKVACFCFWVDIIFETARFRIYMEILKSRGSSVQVTNFKFYRTVYFRIITSLVIQAIWSSETLY